MRRIKTYALLLVGALALAPSLALADEEGEKKVEPTEAEKGREVEIESKDGKTVNDKTVIRGRIKILGPDGKMQEFDLEDLIEGDAAIPFNKGLEGFFGEDVDPAALQKLIRKFMRDAMGPRGRALGEGGAKDEPCPRCGRGDAGAFGMFGDGTSPHLEEMLRGLMGGHGPMGGFPGMGPRGGPFGPGGMHAEHQVRTFVNDGSGWREVPQGRQGRRWFGRGGMLRHGPFGRGSGMGMGAPGMGGFGRGMGMGGRAPMSPEQALEMAEQLQKRAEEMRKHADELKQQLDARKAREEAAKEREDAIPPEIRKELERGAAPFGRGVPGMGGPMGGPGMGGPDEEQLERRIKMLEEMLQRLRKSKEAAEKKEK